MRDEKSVLMQSPFHWNGREGHTPRWIVLHSTSGGGAASWFQNPQAQVSTNYVIEKDGTIINCVDELDAAYGNGPLEPGHAAFWDTIGCNPNLVTISIEHSKAEGNQENLTEAQKAASFYLIQSLCKRWNIPLQAANEHGGIAPHSSLEPVNRKMCPGPYPWQELFALAHPPQQEEILVISLSNPQVANYFVQDGDMWKCKQTGKRVGHAFLDFYRVFGNSALCGLTYIGLPLSDEYKNEHGSIMQRYERMDLGYGSSGHKEDNPPGSGDVFILKKYEGSGIDPRIPQLQQKIDALTRQVNTKPDTQAQAELAKLRATLAHIHEESAA